jgi:hypothetical protein
LCSAVDLVQKLVGIGPGNVGTICGQFVLLR